MKVYLMLVFGICCFLYAICSEPPKAAAEQPQMSYLEALSLAEDFVERSKGKMVYEPARKKLEAIVKSQKSEAEKTAIILKEFPVGKRMVDDGGNADYERGLNCAKEKKYVEAVKWYRKAAEQGNARAQFLLGKHLESGDGVEKNLEEAVKWYRKAGAQGLPEAIERLKKQKSDEYAQAKAEYDRIVRELNRRNRELIEAQDAYNAVLAIAKMGVLAGKMSVGEAIEADQKFKECALRIEQEKAALERLNARKEELRLRYGF